MFFLFQQNANGSHAVDIDTPNGDVQFVKRNQLQETIHVTQTAARNFWREHKTLIIRVILVILLLFYIAYFIVSMIHEFGSEESVRLLWMTIVLLFGIAVHVILKYRRGDASQPPEPDTTTTTITTKPETKLGKYGLIISW